MRAVSAAMILWFATIATFGQQIALAQSGAMDHMSSATPSSPPKAEAGNAMVMHHEHASGAAVSYAELKNTVAELDAARRGTEKYKDVRLAEADGYRAYGPDVPGMGIHYVREHANDAFSLEQPAILLYEKNPNAPGGVALVGVSYLLTSAEGTDGQPVDAPFPKALAKWHRHENICVLPDRSTPKGLSAEECAARGGNFTVETQWMVHAWIWKDSPLGVFSPTNPNVQ